jgi:hypothetical protein
LRSGASMTESENTTWEITRRKYGERIEDEKKR